MTVAGVQMLAFPAAVIGLLGAVISALGAVISALGAVISALGAVIGTPEMVISRSETVTGKAEAAEADAGIAGRNGMWMLRLPGAGERVFGAFFTILLCIIAMEFSIFM